MPTPKPQGTSTEVGKTSLAKQPAPIRDCRGRLKAAEPSARGRAKHGGGASPAPTLCDGQWRGEVHTPYKGGLPQMYVPVVDRNQNPLMPTKPSRARRWIKSGKATPFWKRGVFCVRLNVEPSARKTQPIAVGIDPGSKKEGFSVKSRAHTYLNIERDMSSSAEGCGECADTGRHLAGSQDGTAQSEAFHQAPGQGGVGS